MVNQPCLDVMTVYSLSVCEWYIVYALLQVIPHEKVADVDAVAKDKIEELLVRHGLTDVPLTDVNKEKVIQDLLVAEVLVTRTLALGTFFKGLHCLGLGDLLRQQPGISSFVFPTPEEISVDVG